MTLAHARQWLGLYFLMTTSVTGAVILLFGGGTVIPLEEKDVTASFQIVIPVLLGQLAVIFQWLGRHEAESSDKRPCPVPEWAIRMPPILGAVIMLTAVVTLFLSNQEGTKWIRFSPSRFQATLTFVVSLLNASTIVLVGRLFPSLPNGKGKEPSDPAATPEKT